MNSLKPNDMKRTLAALAFSLFVIAAKGQDNTFSLQQAQDYALQNNYDLKKARTDVEISQKKIWETTSIGLPQITGEGSFQHFLDIPTQVIPAAAFSPGAPEDQFVGVQFGTDYNVSGTITATQLIFDGSYLVGLRASKVYKSLSEQAVEKTEQDVKHNVTNAYYVALVAAENKRVLDSTYQTMKKLFDEMTAIANEGLADQQDADQLQITVLSIENSIKNAERQADIAKNLLKLEMGYDLRQPITLTDELSTLAEATADDGLLNSEFNASNNIEYQLLQTQTELADLNVQNIKADGLPSLGAFFSHSQNAFRTEFNFFENEPWYPATLWGLNLQVPIYSFGRQRARVAQAEMQLEQNQTTLTQVDQGLQLQAMQAEYNYNTNWEILENQKSNLELAVSIQRKTLIKYKEGLATSMELSQAHNQYLNTQAQYIGAMLNFLQAKAELRKIKGKP